MAGPTSPRARLGAGSSPLPWPAAGMRYSGSLATGWPRCKLCSRIWWVRPVAGSHSSREVSLAASYPRTRSRVHAALPSGWQSQLVAPCALSTRIGSRTSSCAPEASRPRTRARYCLRSRPATISAPSSAAASAVRGSRSTPEVCLSSRCSTWMPPLAPHAWSRWSSGRSAWMISTSELRRKRPAWCTGMPAGLSTTRRLSSQWSSLTGAAGTLGSSRTTMCSSLSP